MSSFEFSGPVTQPIIASSNSSIEVDLSRETKLNVQPPKQVLNEVERKDKFLNTYLSISSLHYDENCVLLSHIVSVVRGENIPAIEEYYGPNEKVNEKEENEQKQAKKKQKCQTDQDRLKQEQAAAVKLRSRLADKSAEINRLRQEIKRLSAENTGLQQQRPFPATTVSTANNFEKQADKVLKCTCTEQLKDIVTQFDEKINLFSTLLLDQEDSQNEQKNSWQQLQNTLHSILTLLHMAVAPVLLNNQDNDNDNGNASKKAMNDACTDPITTNSRKRNRQIVDQEDGKDVEELSNPAKKRKLTELHDYFKQDSDDVESESNQKE